MEEDNNKKGLATVATSYREKVADIQFHADKMKEVFICYAKYSLDTISP